MLCIVIRIYILLGQKQKTKKKKKKKNRLMLCFQGVEFVFKDIQTSLEGVEPYQATSILGSRM